MVLACTSLKPGGNQQVRGPAAIADPATVMPTTNKNNTTIFFMFLLLSML
jgi:hypothetical protein